MSAGVIIGQSRHNRSLREKIATTSHEIARQKEQNPLLTTPNRTRSTTQSQRNRQSEARFVHAKLQIDDFFEILERDRTGQALFEVLPDFIQSIQHLNSDELMKLFESLQEGNPDKGNLELFQGIFSMMLLSLATELDPQPDFEILNGLTPDQQLTLFPTLLKKDPEGAQTWLRNTDLSRRNRSQIESVLISRLMTENPLQGIRTMREFQLGSPNNTIGRAFIVSDDHVPLIEQAYHAPENEGLKKHLSKILMLSAHSQKGVVGAKEQASKLNLQSDEIIDFVGNALIHNTKNTGDLLDWAMEDVPEGESKFNGVLYNSIQLWANDDFGSAAEWLQTIGPSDYRDTAIDGFARSITLVDPEAAAVWALEIQSPKKSEKVLNYVLKYWNGTDSEAAKAWSKAREETDQ